MDDSQRIASRLHKFRPSLTLSLKQLVEERRARGLPVYDFGLGETKGELDDEIREAGAGAFHEGRTMYTDPAGLPELRRAVLGWLDLEAHYEPGDVVISTGAKQSLLNIFLATCNTADPVLLDAAPWVSYQPLATIADAFPVMVLPLHSRRKHFKITVRDLERNLDARPHARLFLLNNPVNPTGQLYTAPEIEALLRVCVERRLYFVLDRLYWRILFDGHAYPAPRQDDETRPWIIHVDGLSKNFRRTGGLRIGWAVGPRDVVDAMVNVQSHYTAGPATPTQQAALAAITRPYSSGLVDELQAKRDLLHREAAAVPHVKIWPTEATFYSFWDVRDVIGMRTPDGRVLATSDDLAAYLLAAGGVITASGVGFMRDGYLRLSFAVPDADIVAGMRAVAEALAALETASPARPAGRVRTPPPVPAR